jgi:Thermoplasma acidophilum protein TA0956.
MTDCAMYNLTMEGSHPSTICVVLRHLPDSMRALKGMFGSEYMDEMLQEFISEYARTDEIMPDDRTVGFVVVNIPKKQVSIAFNHLEKNIEKELREISNSMEDLGFKVDFDLD